MIKENKKFLLVEQEFDSCFKNLESKAKLCSLGKIENMQLSFREARKNLNFIQCQQRILIKETITIPDFKYCQFLAKYFSVNLFGFKNLDCFQNLCYFVLLILIIIIFLFLGFTIGENYLCQGFCYYFIVTFIGISLWPLSFLLGTLVMSPLLWLIEKQKQVTIKSHQFN
ncbi:MAG: hypothetical protein HC784_08470 [Hydrococcus sp. CSU_1_8]|nr:hypothetical protein [Hydrococcus sp. CSU_1_8]